MQALSIHMSIRMFIHVSMHMPVNDDDGAQIQQDLETHPCIGMCIDTCVDVHVCRHMHRHVCTG